MKTRILPNIFISVAVFFALTGVVTAEKPQPTIITFDAPGAIFFTLVAGINPSGVITGGYLDANIVEHTYLRAPDGTFTTVDAPGAGTGPFQGTGPNGMNPAGAITGAVTDSTNATHGYLRAQDGTITSFDAPGAGPIGTVGFGINPAGVIAGIYGDASNVFHGFVRAKDGTITTFDPPGSIQTLVPFGTPINPAGVIVGQYFDGSNVSHGYVRAPDGAITMIDAPGAGTAPGTGTVANGINPAGTIEGFFAESNLSIPNHGFVLDANGTFTIFDAPGAGAIGTNPVSINAHGVITGWYTDASNVFHGFVRARDGNITTIDVTGAGTCPFQGTQAVATNPAGATAGIYIDSNNVAHGFLRSP